MQARRFSHLILLLVLGLFLMATVTGVSFGVEGGVEEPCLEKCFLNFLAFFILPWVVAGTVIFLEYRRRNGVSSDKL